MVAPMVAMGAMELGKELLSGSSNADSTAGDTFGSSSTGVKINATFGGTKTPVWDSIGGTPETGLPIMIIGGVIVLLLFLRLKK